MSRFICYWLVLLLSACGSKNYFSGKGVDTNTPLESAMASLENNDPDAAIAILKATLPQTQQDALNKAEPSSATFSNDAATALSSLALADRPTALLLGEAYRQKAGVSTITLLSNISNSFSSASALALNTCELDNTLKSMVQDFTDVHTSSLGPIAWAWFLGIYGGYSVVATALKMDQSLATYQCTSSTPKPTASSTMSSLINDLALVSIVFTLLDVNKDFKISNDEISSVNGIETAAYFYLIYNAFDAGIKGLTDLVAIEKDKGNTIAALDAALARFNAYKTILSTLVIKNADGTSLACGTDVRTAESTKTCVGQFFVGLTNCTI